MPIEGKQTWHSKKLFLIKISTSSTSKQDYFVVGRFLQLFVMDC